MKRGKTLIFSILILFWLPVGAELDVILDETLTERGASRIQVAGKRLMNALEGAVLSLTDLAEAGESPEDQDVNELGKVWNHYFKGVPGGPETIRKNFIRMVELLSSSEELRIRDGGKKCISTNPDTETVAFVLMARDPVSGEYVKVDSNEHRSIVTDRAIVYACPALLRETNDFSILKTLIHELSHLVGMQDIVYDHEGLEQLTPLQKSQNPDNHAGFAIGLVQAARGNSI